MNRGRLPPGRLFFLLPTKERTKENCRCFDAADPRLGGCTPPSPPKRKSEGPTAKRTQYYCPFLTPSGLPPLLSRVFPRTPASDNSCSVGAAYMPPATYRSNPFPGNLRTLQRGGLPPSLAPLVHTPFPPSRRGRACPARSLAVTAPLSLASQGGSSPLRSGQRAGRPTSYPLTAAYLRGVGDAAPTGIIASLPAICRGGIHPSRDASPSSPVLQSSSLTPPDSPPPAADPLP